MSIVGWLGIDLQPRDIIRSVEAAWQLAAFAILDQVYLLTIIRWVFDHVELMLGDELKREMKAQRGNCSALKLNPESGGQLDGPDRNPWTLRTSVRIQALYRSLSQLDINDIARLCPTPAKSLCMASLSLLDLCVHCDLVSDMAQSHCILLCMALKHYCGRFRFRRCRLYLDISPTSICTCG
jgi:hypothetical protein